MKKTITEVETAIENRIAELEEEYELDIYDRNDIREEEYQISSKESQEAPQQRLGLCLVSPVLVWYDTQNRCQMFVYIMAAVLLAIVAFQR